MNVRGDTVNISQSMNDTTEGHRGIWDSNMYKKWSERSKFR